MSDWRARLRRREALRIGQEADGTQVLDSSANAVDLSGADWTTDGTTTSANATASPSGAFDARLVTESSGGTLHRFYGQGAAPVLGNTPFTFSIYAKPNLGRRFIQLIMTGGGKLNDMWFDLWSGRPCDAGTRTSPGANDLIIAARVEPARFGWKKIIFWVNQTNNLDFYNIALSQGSSYAGSTISGGVASYSGDAVSGVYMWRAKVAESMQ